MKENLSLDFRLKKIIDEARNHVLEEMKQWFNELRA